MTTRILLTGLILISASLTSTSQMLFRGTIQDKTDSTLIRGSTVTNINSGERTVSNEKGEFSINADFYDRLVVTAVGYSPDTIKVSPQLFLRAPDIFLVRQFSSMQSVTVIADQHAVDSAGSRTYYQAIRDDHRDRMVKRRSVHGEPGFGIAFSPLSYFSERARSRRQLLKRLDKNEKADYVSYRFSTQLVTRYTGLKGDSLRSFMLQYRPGYDFCTKASEEDMLFYINDCLKKYLHPVSDKVRKR